MPHLEVCLVLVLLVDLLHHLRLQRPQQHVVAHACSMQRQRGAPCAAAQHADVGALTAQPGAAGALRAIAGRRHAGLRSTFGTRGKATAVDWSQTDPPNSPQAMEKKSSKVGKIVQVERRMCTSSWAGWISRFWRHAPAARVPWRPVAASPPRCPPGRSPPRPVLCGRPDLAPRSGLCAVSSVQAAHC